MLQCLTLYIDQAGDIEISEFCMAEKCTVLFQRVLLAYYWSVPKSSLPVRSKSMS